MAITSHLEQYLVVTEQRREIPLIANDSENVTEIISYSNFTALTN